jgi:hypothetical protein
MRPKIVLLLIFVTFFINGCSVYDSKRGIFVSSSIQTVPYAISSSIRDITLSPFVYPKEGLSATQNNTFALSGTIFLPVSHTYVYDDVDRKYLRQSIVNSLEASGVKVVDSSENKLDIRFQQIGMVSSGGGTVLVLDADVTVSGQRVTTKRITVKGTEGLTVAGSKDRTVKSFIEKIFQLL